MLTTLARIDSMIFRADSIVRTGFIKMTESAFSIGDIAECCGFSVAVADCAIKRQRLSVRARAPSDSRPRIVDIADVIERYGFSTAVADCAMKRQRLSVEIERLLILAQRLVD